MSQILIFNLQLSTFNLLRQAGASIISRSTPLRYQTSQIMWESSTAAIDLLAVRPNRRIWPDICWPTRGSSKPWKRHSTCRPVRDRVAAS